MKVIPKLQQGNTIESDNTKVVRPEIHEPIKAKPRQYSIVDLGGVPSNDTRSAAERNRDYWHPIKGAKARFRASMSNETNPLVGIERTILPSAAGAALVTTPAAVVGGALGNMTVDKLTGGWGNWLEDKTGIPSEIGVYTNPGAWYGGAKGYKIGKNKLITKSIKGDADLAWNPIVTKFTDYAGKNPISKVVGKETEPVMRMGDKEFMTFRQPGTDYIGPIDDVAGHLVKFQMNKGKLGQTSQDMWKFNPADYAKRWNDSPNTANQVRLIKQAALMDKVGRPFILQQSNPIWIEGKSVRNPELVTMAHGGRFDFKKSPLLKKQEEINGKRDMRKKFIKSSLPTYKKRIKKAQQGMRFVSYNPVSNPTIDYKDITNPTNPFSEYNYNTTYDKPEALVVPVRDTNETDVVANNPTVEPVINKPVASKSVTDKPVTKTANSTWKSPYTNRKQWSTELINAYKKAGITNDNAIRMLLAQDALESSWGKSAQGKYNFGNLTTGSSWKGNYVTGNDKNAKGEAIKQKFRSYNSMDEYAADKIQFLKRLYDFDENDDINKFVAKLTGSNKGKRRYAEATNYAKVLTGVYNGIPKGENGMIIKYQEPAQPIKYMGGYDKRGNIVLPVNNENGMNNVTLPEVTVTPRNINLAGAVDRGRRTVGNMGKEILSATTPLGDIESAKDIYQDAKSGNYGQAALGAGLLLLPNFIEKPLKALKRVGRKVVKAANKYPAKNLEVNLNPDRSWNMDKIHSDVDKGTKEAIDFLESDIKKETDLYNKRLAKRLGYEHFTPYPNGAERARVKVTPDYETITYPNGEFAGRVAFDADPSKDILQYNKHYNLHPTAYHETLHRGYYGMADKDRMPIGGNLFEHVKRKANTTDFYDFKTRKLLVPENEAPDLETYKYLFEGGEAAANTMELGKRLGLQPGQEYPGRQALEQMLKEFSESGNEHAFITKYLNMKHPKRVWNALTGRYFIYPTVVGTALIGGMNYDRNE